MKLMVQIRILLLSLALTSLVGCEVEHDATQPTVEPTVGQVVIRATQPAMSRTELGEAGDGSQQVRWTVGDELLLWAQSTTNNSYAFEAARFTLATFNAEYTSADFMAWVGSMAEDNYRYTALYPLPTQRTGTTVSYTLPAEQSGAYTPSLDVMHAATTGAALAKSDGLHMDLEWDQPRLHFEHLFHLIRIRIPEGKNNLGLPIKRLEVTFPQEVVGTVTFDALNPEQTAVWSNLTNKITVELDDQNLIDAGKGYVWLHVRPTELDGAISFVAYNEAGVVSHEISTTLQKTMQAQHVTPIALTIPDSPYAPFTYIDLREVANNLGEEWQTMTLSGANFFVPFSANTVATQQFTPNSAKSYKVAISGAPSAMAGKSLSLEYDSAHCLFTETVQLPSSLAGDRYNEVQTTVPYLLEEDFTGATAAADGNDSYKPEGKSNTNVAGVALSGLLSGWNASRYQVFANKYARIGVRYESGAWIVGRYCGRLDTPPLTKLKSGANASIKVVFDMGCYIPNKCYEKTGVFSSGTWDDSNNKMAYCMAGTHTNAANPIDGNNQGGVTDQFTNHATFERMADETGDTGNFVENNFPHKGVSFVASGTDHSTRVCWWALTDREDSVLGKNCHYYIYIDNIKIQIAQ